MNATDLIAFEDDIAAEFAAGNIRAPVHLSGGNEEQLIEIFKKIKPEDWVFCTWRSHYHALLKGVPPAEVRAAIMDGQSITLTFPKYRLFSSAIVGGICPIAVGLAWAIKKRGGSERVWCFIGDMAAESGIHHEAFNYSYGRSLPIKFMIEDNKRSVGVNTKDVWGIREVTDEGDDTYDYNLTRPHVGVGRWVTF
jgi:TPP-dependent pyruvate/acetoin dehydrogenase alpha subunit